MSPKPVDPEAPRRRDGYLERRGTWGEVTVGSLLATSWNRTSRWRIVAVSHPPQIGALETLWMRARDEVSGQEFSIPPRRKTLPVTFLVQDPTEEPPPATPAEDAEQVALLVEKLGAQVIATRDNATGEIHCPQFEGPADSLLDHIRLAHGLDTSGLAALGLDDKIRQSIELHGRLHNRDAANPPSPYGFPHRHVPEYDASIPGI